MRHSFLARIWLIIVICVLLSLAPILYLLDWTASQKFFFAASILAVALALAQFLFKGVQEGLSALEIGLLNLKDGEFSTTLSYQSKDEIGQMCSLYNQTSDKLRAEKHWLHQRELLLDKITQSSPEVLLLVNDKQQVVFSNIAARHFFNLQSGLEGCYLDDLYKTAGKGAQSAIEANKDGLFSILLEGHEPETWHMSTGSFLLNAQSHQLFILKQMTRELSRQEVAVWKKVIRVISHELNNSLGPISSMLHSGRLLSLQVDEDRLARVFATIDERIKHLSDFVQGYGKFAKIPEPKIEAVQCHALFTQLAQQWPFTLLKNKVEYIHADPAQLEQLLINLLKNAHESGSPASDISIELESRYQDTVIIVTDRGKGISESRLNSVLIPFYSTKASGTGLGLALCREIIDAHHGTIALYNRPEGGLMVRVTLPVIGEKAVK